MLLQTPHTSLPSLTALCFLQGEELLLMPCRFTAELSTKGQIKKKCPCAFIGFKFDMTKQPSKVKVMFVLLWLGWMEKWLAMEKCDWMKSDGVMARSSRDEARDECCCKWRKNTPPMSVPGFAAGQGQKTLPSSLHCFRGEGPSYFCRFPQRPSAWKYFQVTCPQRTPPALLPVGTRLVSF